VTPAQLAFGRAMDVLIAAAIVGLLWRGGARLCWSFVAYLVVCLSADVAMGLWPETLWTPSVWSAKEAILTGFKIAVAVELACRVFKGFPRARVRVVAAQAILVVATLVASGGHGGYGDTLTRAIPTSQTGVLWLLVIVAAGVRWHRIPMNDLHRTLLATLSIYLGSTSLLWALGQSDFWRGYGWGAFLDPILYSTTAGVWAVAAWLPVREGASAGVWTPSWSRS
jgi:hypothetical protein